VINSRHAVIDTVIGEITVVATADAIVGLYFPDHWTNPSRDAFGPRVAVEDDPLVTTARTQLTEYLSGLRTSFDVPTSAPGSVFQQQVWAMLVEIPRGETTTYGELAARVGGTSLARLVGQAVGHNPLSIIVPCHRVVGKNGTLTGYAGGLARKQFLLELESPSPVAAGRLF
jgi:methylated-DNA-[protein]-cysteine S-methyltransferase